MPLVLSNLGKTDLLNLKRNTLNQWTIRLFQNNYVPAANMTNAAFQEANFNGYAQKAITFSNPPVLLANGKASITSALITWIPTVAGLANTIFGYYVTNGANTSVYFAERNPAGGIIVGQDLSPFTVQLNFTEDTDPT